MPYLSLVLGIAVPWLTGFLAMRCLLGSGRSGTGVLAQVAYGYFLGYFLLHLVVMAASHAGGVEFLTVLVAMLAIGALAGGWLAATRGRTAPPTVPAVPGVRQAFRQTSAGTKVLLVLLAAWALLHLTLAAIQVLAVPLFPWDAWLVWVYRAKASFHAAQMLELVPPTTWLEASEPRTYAIFAHSYPDFASVIPFWTALSFGRWSEVLINVPVVFCGVAIGLGLFAQARACGYGLMACVISVYLLYSVPLLGTHLSLGGYADIWLAGFTGMGFIALLKGILHEDRREWLVGLLFITLGCWVKNEGVVWLYAAAVLLTLTLVRPRVLGIVVGVLAAVSAIAWMTGVTAIDIPWLGRLGVEGRYFHIPLVGSHEFAFFDNTAAYAHNLFELGSWNLTWVLMAGILLLAMTDMSRRSSRVAVAFLLVFALSQWWIFFLSEQGHWARSYTAINRLPLQFLPALLFAALVVIAPRFAPVDRTEKPGHG